MSFPINVVALTSLVTPAELFLPGVSTDGKTITLARATVTAGYVYRRALAAGAGQPSFGALTTGELPAGAVTIIGGSGGTLALASSSTLTITGCNATLSGTTSLATLTLSTPVSATNGLYSNGGTVTLSATSSMSFGSIVASGSGSFGNVVKLVFATTSPSTVGTPSIAYANTYSFTPASGNLIAGNLAGDVLLTDSSIGTFANGTGAATISSSTVISYILGVGSNGNGYDVSAINVYSGWNDSGRSNITLNNFTYSTVADPTTFITISSTALSYSPGNSHAVANLTATGGVLATGVYAIRFNFGTQQNGFVGYKELEVVGTSSPNSFNMGTEALPAIAFTAGGATGIYYPNANSLGFSVNGVEKIRVSTVGVGIGTKTPTATLDVAGVLKATSTGLVTVNGSLTIGISGAQAVASSWFSNTGFWLDIPTGGPSGIGSGGAGQNAWIAYANGNGVWLSDASSGDIIYRNTGGKMRFGTVAGGPSILVISGSTVTIGTTGTFLASGTSQHQIGTLVVNQNSLTLSGAADMVIGGTGSNSTPGSMTITKALIASGTNNSFETLGVKSGSNKSCGLGTLTAGSVTVSNTRVTASSIIELTIQVAGGTVGVPYKGTVVAGTSFDILSTSLLDTSVVGWLIVEPT